LAVVVVVDGYETQPSHHGGVTDGAGQVDEGADFAVEPWVDDLDQRLETRQRRAGVGQSPERGDRAGPAPGGRYDDVVLGEAG
jgi:hypothetical protein